MSAVSPPAGKAPGKFFGFSYEVGVNLGTHLMNTRKNIITYEAYKK